jgi:hypothetical protein
MNYHLEMKNIRAMSRAAEMPAAVFAVVFSIAPLFGQTIPKTWDEAALSGSLLPPPFKSANIQQVPADYYYRMPERVMFRRYPVYASGSEPAGYLQQLAQAEPERTFDPARLKTEQAWVDAGREVFRYPIAALPIEARCRHLVQHRIHRARPLRHRLTMALSGRLINDVIRPGF